jgi:transposase-like protein
MEAPAGRPLLRIGELSRRVGVSDHLLRAWESRYGLLQPVRSPGGFRLYSEADESRIRQMQAYLAEGLSAAEAARAALGGGAVSGGRAGTPTAAPAGGEPSAARGDSTRHRRVRCRRPRVVWPGRGRVRPA